MTSPMIIPPPPAEPEMPDTIVLIRSLPHGVMEEFYDFARRERLTKVRFDGAPGGFARESFSQIDDKVHLREVFALYRQRGGRISEEAVFPRAPMISMPDGSIFYSMCRGHDGKPAAVFSTPEGVQIFSFETLRDRSRFDPMTPTDVQTQLDHARHISRHLESWLVNGSMEIEKMISVADVMADLGKRKPAAKPSTSPRKSSWLP